MNTPKLRPLGSPAKPAARALSAASRTSGAVPVRAALPVLGNRAFIRAWIARRMQAAAKAGHPHVD
jgi:hypothetical protein